MREDCIFCQIVARRAPAHRVLEDERTLAFMDIAPVAHGHALVIPKAHCDDLLGVEADDLAAVACQSRRLARAIHDVLTPDGIGVYQLNGAAAGQTVFHYHVHLVPRMHGDPLGLQARGPGDPEKLAEVALALAAALPVS